MNKFQKILMCILINILSYPIAAKDGSQVQIGWAKRPVDFVDPFIGTSNSRWVLNPGPSMPFGMVQLAPDNQDTGWKAGYEYKINNIAGFSHIHAWTLAGLLVMPATGEIQIRPSDENKPWQGYRSSFKKENEVSKVGYYSVLLDKYNVKAELTSTTRVGVHRYTFPKSYRSHILFDLNINDEYGYDLSNSFVTKVSDHEIQGFTYQQGRGGARFEDYSVCFYIRFSKPFLTFNGWVKDKIYYDIEKDYSSGWGNKSAGFFVEYDTEKDERIIVEVGISYVSPQQAKLNLETEMKPFGWDFDAVVRYNQETWNNILGTIEVQAQDEQAMRKFYTNMYRAYTSRSIMSDVDGKYIDMYEKVQQTKRPEDVVIGCDAFWNTFWNLNGLWNLVTPKVSKMFVNSLLEIYDKGGWLPKGPAGIEYSGIMVASHSIELICSAYLAGIRDIDVAKAMKAMLHQQLVPGRPHEGGGWVGNRYLQSYMDYGYVTNEDGPASNTLEYAYDDWALGEFAKAIGDDANYQKFHKRSLNFRNIFDKDVRYVRMKNANGSWVEPFDSLGYTTFLGSGFVEGNSWQYTWFVPQDVKYVVDFLGRNTFINRLNNGFKKSEPWHFSSESVNFSESLNSMGVLPINHGNQPNMQAAYLFNYAGSPWLTQRWVRAIMRDFYGDKPEGGWMGDEDEGQMGSWYVLSAMGLFQMQGGCAVEPVWDLGSPMFPKVTIHLDKDYYSGRTFIIEAKNASPQNIYVQKAYLNGKPLDNPWIYHKDIVHGGTLCFIMGSKPNKKWGGSVTSVAPTGYAGENI